MILSSVLLVLCLVGPSLAKPATIVSGFGVDEILKEAQKQQTGIKNVDSSPEVGVIDSSTSQENSHEKSNEKSHEKPHHHHHQEETTPDVVMGREHIHDPEHGNEDVIIDERNKFHKVTQMFGADEDIEVGGNSEFPSQQSKWNPEVISGGQQNFKKGFAPTEIVWSPSVMSNGYNGGVRRPEYRHAAYFVRSH